MKGMKKLPMSPKPPLPKAGRHGQAKPRLRTRHLSTTGKSAFAGGPPGGGMAFPPGPPGGDAGAPAFPSPDMGGGAPGGGVPDLGGGALAGPSGGPPGM